ncbi:MAG: 30S ribosomal protein S20 [Candidatus Yonathbacteria bacterium RIFCSPHIGHO2_01_FULL_51_10]|uniref:Small ribosomal subunit protein bS20 n=1 Tax=Candidatus Yonathbacteria bacterium RIFCSPHIGHO2_01_FULL_51_10 TaxID=1802723 RepID=A0A1G2S647_9BACT|nr:MAG: 30S ribosomal protein S20 [Candidatus Yonathbacteria bacterium RIFCSPHIGHO2_01_FULL_51_10]
MPIIKSAKKALRSSMRKKLYNDRRSRTMKDAVKTVKKSISEKSKETVKDMSAAYQAIDKAAKRGIIKKNAAARKKSRLMKMAKKSA